MAYAWRDGTYLGSKYLGDNYKTLWDPFGNLPDWTYVGLKVCMVDGPSGANPTACDSASVDISE
ncbi:hypothetical protein [Streptomyces sp. NPDC127197]